jgi:glycosidase
MQWSPDPGAGFTAPGTAPWLPLGDHGACNVAQQREDPDSVLNFCRDVIALRRASRELRRAPYETLAGSGVAWAWRRGERYVVALNMADERSTLTGASGTVAISTRRERTGERLRGRVDLEPWEGVIVDLSSSG